MMIKLILFVAVSTAAFSEDAVLRNSFEALRGLKLDYEKHGQVYTASQNSVYYAQLLLILHELTSTKSELDNLKLIEDINKIVNESDQKVKGDNKKDGERFIYSTVDQIQHSVRTEGP